MQVQKVKYGKFLMLVYQYFIFCQKKIYIYKTMELIWYSYVHYYSKARCWQDSLKRSLMLTTSAFIFSKKQKYCEIVFQFKKTVFYFNVFYLSDPKLNSFHLILAIFGVT